MFVFDGHLDLAMNALVLNRKLTLTVARIRKLEKELYGERRPTCTVSLSEMQKGRIGVCLASILARKMVDNVWKSYDTSEISFMVARKQLAYYKNLERKKYIKIISDFYTLDFHIENLLKDDESTKIGCILSMEGADAIKKPEDLTYWWKDGLRVLSLTHYGSNVYACGTGYKGGITREGIKLLELSQKAVKLYEKQPMHEKRRILNFVCSNSVWKDGRLQPVYRQPFEILAVTNREYQQNKPCSEKQTGRLRENKKAVFLGGKRPVFWWWSQRDSNPCFRRERPTS